MKMTFGTPKWLRKNANQISTVVYLHSHEEKCPELISILNFWIIVCKMYWRFCTFLSDTAHIENIYTNCTLRTVCFCISLHNKIYVETSSTLLVLEK